MSADRIIQELPALAKISSPDRVMQLRSLAVRGVALRHLPSPPRDIVARSGFHYFEIVQAGEHWSAIEEARTFGFYVPAEFAELEMECVAVRRS